MQNQHCSDTVFWFVCSQSLFAVQLNNLYEKVFKCIHQIYQNKANMWKCSYHVSLRTFMKLIFTSVQHFFSLVYLYICNTIPTTYAEFIFIFGDKIGFIFYKIRLYTFQQTLPCTLLRTLNSCIQCVLIYILDIISNVYCL